MDGRALVDLLKHSDVNDWPLTTWSLRLNLHILSNSCKHAAISTKLHRAWMTPEGNGPYAWTITCWVFKLKHVCKVDLHYFILGLSKSLKTFSMPRDKHRNLTLNGFVCSWRYDVSWTDLGIEGLRKMRHATLVTTRSFAPGARKLCESLLEVRQGGFSIFKMEPRSSVGRRNKVSWSKRDKACI